MMDSISSSERPPGLSKTGSFSAKEMMVDSTPTVQGPPSKIIFTLFPNDFRTCSAVVGLTCPKGLALGAAMGRPDSRISSNAMGWLGTRIATLGKEEVTMSGTRGDLGRTIVRGPGQNLSMSFKAFSGTR